MTPSTGERVAALDAYDTLTVGELVRVVLRRWAVLLVVVALACGVAVLWSRLVPASFTATATVDVTADPSSGVGLSDVTAATESDIVASLAVSQRAADALRAEVPGVSAAHVRASVSVTAPRQTRVLQISYAAPTPREAAAGANAVANAYISLRRDLSRQRLDRQEHRVRGQLEAALATINDLPRSQGVQRQYAHSEAKRLSAQLNRLEWTTVDSGQVVDRAPTPTSSSGPSLAVYLVGGLLVGLLVGIPLAIAADRVAIGRRR